MSNSNGSSHSGGRWHIHRNELERCDRELGLVTTCTAGGTGTGTLIQRV